MTTYELPPEPPIGSRVRDANGSTWTRSDPSAFPWRNASRRWSWQDLLMDHGPVTLIEPDPWPTDDLIVADWIAGAIKGHGLLYLDGHEYVTIESGHVLREGRDTLTNVVPVTVVPVAGVEALRASIKALGYGPQDTRGMPDSLLDTALRVLEATDALGVSND